MAGMTTEQVIEQGLGQLPPDVVANMAKTALRGGLKGEVGTSPVFTLPEGTPAEKIDASSIDVLQLADSILKGKPFAAGVCAVKLCQREKMGADHLAVHLATCFAPSEIAYMLALSLVTLGAK